MVKKNMLCFMLTNIVEESTELLCFGKEALEIIEEAFDKKLEKNVVKVSGLVSRKKQLVPSFMKAISRISGV